MNFPYRAITLALFILFGACLSSFTTINQPVISTPLSAENPCNENAFLSDFVFATDDVYTVSKEIISAQTILQNANVTYRSGSGTTLSFGMTGSLSGPSEGFQIYPGSTLSVEIQVDCMHTD